MVSCESANCQLSSVNYLLPLSLRPKINHLKKIRVAAVNYLNTKPLLYGIKRSAVMNEIELIETYPANVAKALLDGSSDVGLVPVAIIPQLKESHIITDYCIGCDGPVASVCIFSDVPMEEIKKIYLDYQSITSVQLAKILLKEYWENAAELVEAKGEEYLTQINGTTAGLVIGDRALQQRSRSEYIYDLGEAWKTHTGLSFVFAVWVSNKQLPQKFIADFNRANKEGVKNRNKVIIENSFYFDMDTYFTKNISYRLTEEKKEGLALFLSKLK